MSQQPPPPPPGWQPPPYQGPPYPPPPQYGYGRPPMQARTGAQYVRQQTGHSVILHFLLACLTCGISLIWTFRYLGSPNHYFHL